MPHLVATDLDGTLLRRDGTVSQRTRDALRNAREAGIEVVYATGRPPRWLQHVYDVTGHEPLTICANGALILHGDEVVHIDPIDPQSLAQVRRLLLAHRPDFEIRTEEWNGHTLKLLAALPDVDRRHADEVLTEVHEVAGHLVEPTHSAFNTLLIEMGPARVNKAAALRRIREQRWPGHTAIGIGDMPNDVAMLRSVDVPMTVQTGHPGLREIADHVLPGPEQDGIAQLLEHLAAGGDVSRFTAP